MLGVVVWSDTAESKAIIWCEDHGELAFLAGAPHPAASAERFDEGDLIQFDLAEYRDLRLVRNPRKIAGHYCTELGDVIVKAGHVRTEIEGKSPSQNVQGERPGDNLVDLCSARMRRTARGKGEAA